LIPSKGFPGWLEWIDPDARLDLTLNLLGSSKEEAARSSMHVDCGISIINQTKLVGQQGRKEETA
jgi:hypothetical protein